MTLHAPRPLTTEHDLSDFSCGQPTLDRWLAQRALRNQTSGASRTYVACDDQKVVGYYCLANGAVAHADAAGRVRRNMPDPIPVMVLGRLAVDHRHHGTGLGSALLRDAILRTLNAAEIAGIRAILVHALDADAAAFYRRRGFLNSPMDDLVLMLPLETARRAIEADRATD